MTESINTPPTMASPCVFQHTDVRLDSLNSDHRVQLLTELVFALLQLQLNMVAESMTSWYAKQSLVVMTGNIISNFLHPQNLRIENVHRLPHALLISMSITVRHQRKTGYVNPSALVAVPKLNTIHQLPLLTEHAFVVTQQRLSL
jgi:hypothetical protein